MATRAAPLGSGSGDAGGSSPGEVAVTADAKGAERLAAQEEGPGADPLSHARQAAVAWLLTVMHDDAQPMAHRLQAASLLLAR